MSASDTNKYSSSNQEPNFSDIQNENRQKQYAIAYKQLYLTIERNINTLERISYKDKLENLCLNLTDEKTIYNNIENNCFSFSEYIGIAKLLRFWESIINNSIINARRSSQEMNVLHFCFTNIVQKRIAGTSKYRIYNNTAYKVIKEILEKQIGESCCDVIFRVYQTLLAIDEDKPSELPNKPIIPQKLFNIINNENILQVNSLPMKLFYKDFMQIWCWKILFKEIAELLGNLLYETLTQHYNFANQHHAYLLIKNGVCSALNLLELPEKTLREKIWLTLQDDNINYHDETPYIISYTIGLYNNSDNTNKLMPILLDGINPKTSQLFEPLWSKLKEYREYRDLQEVSIISLIDHVNFQNIKTLDKAIDYLKYVEIEKKRNLLQESPKVSDSSNATENINTECAFYADSKSVQTHTPDEGNTLQTNDFEQNTIVTSTSTFCLKLDDTTIKYLYEKMNNVYFENTSLELFIYILTGRKESEQPQKIKWIASSRCFAVFIGIVCREYQNKWDMALKHFSGHFNQNLASDYSRFCKKYDTNMHSIPKDFDKKTTYNNEKDKSLKELMVILSKIY